MDNTEIRTTIMSICGWVACAALIMGSLYFLNRGLRIIAVKTDIGLALILGSLIGLLLSVYFIRRMSAMNKKEIATKTTRAFGWIITIPLFLVSAGALMTGVFALTQGETSYLYIGVGIGGIGGLAISEFLRYLLGERSTKAEMVKEMTKIISGLIGFSLFLAVMVFVGRIIKPLWDAVALFL